MSEKQNGSTAAEQTEADAAQAHAAQAHAHTHHHSHHHHSSHSHEHSHHHSHSSHRSHSSRRKKRRSRGHGEQEGFWKRLGAFLKERRSLIVNVVSCAISLVCIFVLAAKFDLFQPKDEADVLSVTQDTVKIETTVFTKKQSLVSEAVTTYLSPTNTLSVTEVYKSFGGSKAALNVGRPVTIQYYVTGLPAEITAKSALLELTEKEGDWSDSLKYPLDLSTSIRNVSNLKTGTKYYYRITLTLDPEAVLTTGGSFETEATPRIMNIDGGYNLRDIGGWKTADGSTIRQGLLYRGCEIDGAVEEKYTLTDRGIQQMIGELGIRFDMDLRSTAEVGERTSALGKNVVHKYYGAELYKSVFREDQAAVLRAIFSDLANPDNYPIYMHCTYGRDRSGTICYLLEALLGVSDEDLLREYELSALTDSYVNRGDFDEFVAQLQARDGATTKDKVEGFLLSVGVTPAEIASLRAIYLEQE